MRTLAPTLLFVASAIWPCCSHAAGGNAAVELEIRLAKPVLLAHQKNVAFLKIGLVGRKAEKRTARPPVNLCIAIDKSGSMAGEKIDKAREGALQAVRHLREADTISVVAYDSTVHLLVPATHASERRAIERGIKALEAGGSTALFAGVAKCAEELRKFGDQDRASRIVLLSDGQANVGPSSPADLGALGAELMSEGISVSTVGVGLDYNEDLMAELAVRSDGRHTFVRYAADLTRFFDQELGALTNVVARDVEIRIRCSPGSRPVRVLGRRADVVGDTVTAPFGKVYGGREHFFILELELGATAAVSGREIADVEVVFRDLLRNQVDRQRRIATVALTTKPKEVEARTDGYVMSQIAMLQSDEATGEAIRLRDQGNVEGARAVLRRSAADLDASARQYKASFVRQRQIQSDKAAREVSPSPAQWNESRKQMRQEMNDTQLEGMMR